MKKTAARLILLSAACLFFFAAGVLLQQNHVFHALKRFFRKQPLSLTPPSWSILDWELEQKISQPHEFRLPALSLKDLENQRPAMNKKLGELLRISSLPWEFQWKAEIVERTDLGDVIREKIRIETEPGLWIPFYLLIPKNSGAPVPAIFIFHGHSSDKADTAGLRDSYNQKNGLMLAKAGFATVAPDLRGFGELGWSGDWNDPDGHAIGKTVHIQDILNNLRTGRTSLGAYLFDADRILQYLKTRNEIDSGRIGTAGTSMGGDVAIWFFLFHPEIKAVVASAAGMTGYTNSDKIDYGMYHACADAIPDFHLFFRFREIPLLLAPRPVLIDLYSAEPGKFDSQLEPLLKRLYKEADAAEHLSFRFHLNRESFDNRTAAEWFKRWL